MVRPFLRRQLPVGSLVVEESSSDVVKVDYVPSSQRLSSMGVDPSNIDQHRTHIIELNTASGALTLFPISMISSKEQFLQPKYKKVRKITLADATPVLSPSGQTDDHEVTYSRSITFGPTQPIDDMVTEEDIVSSRWEQDDVVEILEGLPPGFTKDYDYGLGLAQPYRFIVDAIEELTDCTEILISRSVTTGVGTEPTIFNIATDDFDAIRKKLNSNTNITRAASIAVKRSDSYNYFAEALGKPLVSPVLGKHPIRKLLTQVLQGDEPSLSEDEQADVVGVITKHIRPIAEQHREKLVRLQNDIDLVNLEQFIERFRGMLKKSHGEAVWQEFLEGNPLILSLSFGYPTIKVGQQASVGGRKLSRRGETIADFLVKNRMTDNAAVVEIKTPQTQLLNKKEYRNGVYAPSTDLSGAISQTLNQRYEFQRDISGIKDRSRLHDIESYSVRCCLVIGTIPDGEDEKKSFEFVRHNSKDVDIVTFDELFEKLGNLRECLLPPNDDLEGTEEDASVPF